MVTTSNGNIFRVIGPLCGEFPGHRCIPLTKASDAEFLVFSLICAGTNGSANNRDSGDLRRHRAHHDVTIMWFVFHFPLLDILLVTSNSLQWRHNGLDGVSNHQPHDCLLNRLFRRRSKKTSKLCVTGLCVGNSPGTGEFPAQMDSNAENVYIWWLHHDILMWLFP